MRLTALAFVTMTLLAGCGAPPSGDLAATVPASVTSESLQATSTTSTVRPPLPLDLAQSFAAWLEGSGIQLTGGQYTSAFEAARGAYVDALSGGATDPQARAAATRAFEQFVLARM